MTKKYSLRQDFALTLYKACVRPVIEYASEIWDDASQTLKNKLRTIEHKALTTSLGVARLSKRIETNLEAQIMPLELRRQKRTLRAFLKYENDPEIENIRKNKGKKFKKQVRTSLF